MGVKLDIECDNQVPESLGIEVVCDLMKQLMLVICDLREWKLD